MSFTRFLTEPDLPLNLAIERLNRHATQILLVVGTEGELLGTVTDGDIRRAILRHDSLARSVDGIMNRNPLTAARDWSPQQAQTIMRARKVNHLPIVDEYGRVKGIFTEESLISDQPLPNTVVLMVGGYGKRLGKMTSNCPKPMLRIGGKPILQTILELLRDAGLRKFVFTVNYLAEQIISHFGDGSDFGVSIEYFEEDEPLGTAGALGRINLDGEDPLLVMNGDILTRVNFGHLLHYHSESDAAATMCVRLLDQQIPYGVVELDGHEILGLKEKPISSHFINTGIYVISKEALSVIPEKHSFDIPDFFRALQASGEAAIAYPLQEYWTDVGRPEDFEKAEEDFKAVFEIKSY